MSMAEDFGYDIGVPDDFGETTEFVKVLVGDKVQTIEVCVDCGSRNIKTSKKGNRYCADLCWVKTAPIESKE